VQANRYIQQFTEIFTEEGRKSVRITHIVPGQPTRVTCTNSMRDRNIRVAQQAHVQAQHFQAQAQAQPQQLQVQTQQIQVQNPIQVQNQQNCKSVTDLKSCPSTNASCKSCPFPTNSGPDPGARSATSKSTCTCSSAPSVKS